MEEFNRRIKLTPEQRHEVETYLGDFTVMTEFGFLMMVRRIKRIEQQLQEEKYR